MEETEIQSLTILKKGNLIDIKKSKISKTAQEGDVLIYKNGKYIVDKNETEKLRKEI